MGDSERSQPLVSITFSVAGSTGRELAVFPPPPSNTDGTGAGCSSRFSSNVISEEAKLSNTSFLYSGRHDHGDLPLLRDQYDYSSLISALQEAKAKLDNELQVIGSDTSLPGDVDVSGCSTDERNSMAIGSATSPHKKPRSHY